MLLDAALVVSSIISESSVPILNLTVLTKPDRLPHGTPSDKLSDVLDGVRFKLGHGYHVTKNLDQDQIKQGVTHQQARQLEEQFFKTQHPWASDLQAYQQRFGILNLQTFLSRQHAKHALAKLPTIEAEVDKRLASVDEELRGLPETPPHTAVRVILDMLIAFSNEVREEIEGEHGHTAWKNIWQNIKTQFYHYLQGMEPEMGKEKAMRDRNIYSRSLPGASADDPLTVDTDSDTTDDEDDDHSDEVDTPSKKRKTNASSRTTPAKKVSAPTKKATAASTPTKKTNAPPSSRVVPHKQETTRNDTRRGGTKTIHELDKLKYELSLCSQGKVPGNVHPKVLEALMIEPLQYWSMALDAFFRELESRLRKQMKTLFAKHFKDRKDSELYTKAWVIVNEMIDDNLCLQKSTVAAESLNAELEGPYIFHDKVFAEAKRLVLNKCHQDRLNSRMTRFIKEAGRHQYHPRIFTDEKLRRDEKSMAIIKDEPYKTEVEVIAEVKAYYQLAARRFHDAVCMRVESKFFKQLRTELRSELDGRLGISDEANGKSLILSNFLLIHFTN
jgi:hypothetical protein